MAYLDSMAFIHPTYRNDIFDSILDSCRRVQVDADHFGLKKVKKLLVEYLAVVRL